ncbi:hypothetical protein [Corynebacterium sanguinis]|uniref:Uncharacterized protein n=1 Tax=Corynebacterium sanguinis TaxID=2594913 RepID=A0A838WRQ0_9CORY|nr:hypothetical protein [Corynebacterium sanguinis]MBA4505836.1 hypothetical protein [Corynebacterium sanguinis]
MTLFYLAGLVSGVILVVMVLATWIIRAARKLQEGDHHNGAPNAARRAATDAGRPPVARHRAIKRRVTTRATPRSA